MYQGRELKKALKDPRVYAGGLLPALLDLRDGSRVTTVLWFLPAIWVIYNFVVLAWELS